MPNNLAASRWFAAGLLENEREEQPIHLAVRLRVQVTRIPRQPAADESLEVEDRQP